MPTSSLTPYLRPLIDRFAVPTVLDAHTHLGCDVDGTACSAERLLALLDPLQARAVTFPFCVREGYRTANVAVLDVARAADGRIVPFCRVDPDDDPVAEARRALRAGARGIKLHPHSERFTFAHPRIHDILAVAADAGAVVLVHAGVGIEPLGGPLLRAAQSHPGVPIILAHAAVSDLAWLPEALDEAPNLFVDTSWWSAYDVLTLFARVPPGRILFASDAPYFEPELTALVALRCALAVGLDDAAVTSIMGEQLDRLLAGLAPQDLGPAPGEAAIVRDLRTDRVVGYLATAFGCALAGGPVDQGLGLARAALALPDDDPLAGLASAARDALDLTGCGPRGLGGLVIASLLCATPGVPAPSTLPKESSYASTA